MAHGKHAALDLVHGRQGGRIVEYAPGSLAAELAAFRRAHRCIDEHCRLCNRDLPPYDALRRPVSDVEWEDRARMAAARRAAGLRLGPVDLEALDRHPTPPKLTLDGYRVIEEVTPR